MKTNLNYQFVKNLTKPGRYSDALVMGFHIWVKSNGGKYFIFRYTKEGSRELHATQNQWHVDRNVFRHHKHLILSTKQQI